MAKSKKIRSKKILRKNMKMGIKTKAKRKRGGAGDGIINSSEAAKKKASSNVEEAGKVVEQLTSIKEVKDKCFFSNEVTFSSKITEEFKKYIKNECCEKTEQGGSAGKTGVDAGTVVDNKLNGIQQYLIEVLDSANRFTDITSVLDFKILTQDPERYQELLEIIDSTLKEYFYGGADGVQQKYDEQIKKIKNEKLKDLIKTKYEERRKIFIEFCLSEYNKNEDDNLSKILEKTFKDTSESDYLNNKKKIFDINYTENNFIDYIITLEDKYDALKKEKEEEIQDNPNELVNALQILDYLFESNFSIFANTCIKDLFKPSDKKIEIKDTKDSTVPSYNYIIGEIKSIENEETISDPTKKKLKLIDILIEAKKIYLDKKLKIYLENNNKGTSITESYSKYILDLLEDEKFYFGDEVLENLCRVLNIQITEEISDTKQYDNTHIYKHSIIKKHVDDEVKKEAKEKEGYNKEKETQKKLNEKLKDMKDNLSFELKSYFIKKTDVYDIPDLDLDKELGESEEVFNYIDYTSSSSRNNDDSPDSSIINLSKAINELIVKFQEFDIKRFIDFIDDYDPVAAAQQQVGQEQMKEAESGDLNVFRFFIPVYTGRKVRVFTATKEFPSKLEVQSNDYGSYVSSLKNIMEPYTSNIKDAESNPKCLGVLNYSSTGNVFTRDQFKEDASSMCYDRKDSNEIIKKLREDSVKNEEALQNKVTGIARPVFYELGKGVITEEVFFNGDTLAVEVIVALLALQDNREGHRYNLPIFKDKNLEADIKEIDFNLDAPGLRIKLKDLKELKAAREGGISHLFGFRKVDYMANLAAQARYPVNYEVDLEQFVYVVQEKHT